jgi:glycosyltransferase involved in cell wall biosynthesis
MAMGKAIVASRLDQLAEVLSHNDTALLVSPGEVLQLVEAIRLLSEDEGLRRRLGRRAREVAIAQHTWRQNVARVLALAQPEKIELVQELNCPPQSTVAKGAIPNP